MPRQPAHLAAGRPSIRQSVWDRIRARRTFTLADLHRDLDADPATIRSYVLALVAGGRVAETGTRHPAKVYRLARDSGHEAPRLRRDGSPCRQGLCREQMWRTMRMTRIVFTARDLARLASTDDVAVAESDALDYIKHLGRAGYLVAVAPATPKRQARWRFHPAKNTGPKPPMVQRLKTVFDPNLGRIVWHDEVDA